MGKARAGSGQLAAEKPASERAQGAARVSKSTELVYRRLVSHTVWA